MLLIGIFMRGGEKRLSKKGGAKWLIVSELAEVDGNINCPLRARRAIKRD